MRKAKHTFAIVILVFGCQFRLPGGGLTEPVDCWRPHFGGEHEDLLHSTGPITITSSLVRFRCSRCRGWLIMFIPLHGLFVAERARFRPARGLFQVEHSVRAGEQTVFRAKQGVFRVEHGLF
ncbi:MAG TPA: hypothetical protein VK327_05185 [Candidatus Paceibacterota bacterium]|nr:hypothetical protein [Candidatus Paceibacterota bacterium]